MELSGVAVLALSAASLFAQSSAFEAAAVKVNKQGGGPYSRVQPGRLTMTYYTVNELAASAYGMRTEEVIGQPAAERYDIEATFRSATPSNSVIQAMLQNLLADQFHLKAHRESRELPVFFLTIVKGGLKMAAAAGDCVVSPADDGAPALATPRVNPAAPVFYCNHPRFGAKGVNRSLEGKGISLDALAESLSRTELNRTVVNKTGLTGAFDLKLEWIADPTGPSFDRLGGTATASLNGPPIFTALQEQLGLKIEAGRAPVDVLVIDHVEKPHD